MTTLYLSWDHLSRCQTSWFAACPLLSTRGWGKRRRNLRAPSPILESEELVTVETNPSQPNKNEEGDRDQDTTARWQPSEAGMGREGLSLAGTASPPACQPLQAGTRQVPAGGIRVRPTGRSSETPGPAARGQISRESVVGCE